MVPGPERRGTGGGVLIERHSIRGLLVTPEPSVLLIRIRLPRSERRVWLTPGGGRDAGEDSLACLRREVYEETGLAEIPSGPHVWSREHMFGWDGTSIRQREDYYLLRVPRFEPTSRQLPDHEIERELFEQYRWWTLDEIAASDETFVPSTLADELRRLLEHGAPPKPIQVGV